MGIAENLITALSQQKPPVIVSLYMLTHEMSLAVFPYLSYVEGGESVSYQGIRYPPWMRTDPSQTSRSFLFPLTLIAMASAGRVLMHHRIHTW
jgi:hypothetical protein